MEVVNWVLAHGADIVAAVLSILGGFSIIAKLTPTQADDKIIQAILNFIHALGLSKK
jgi:hypothetical protein